MRHILFGEISEEDIFFLAMVHAISVDAYKAYHRIDEPRIDLFSLFKLF